MWADFTTTSFQRKKEFFIKRKIIQIHNNNKNSNHLSTQNNKIKGK